MPPGSLLVDAAAIPTPARLYDLRSTFATNALARGLTLHELARVMGTSTRMIELRYGTLVEGAHGAILARLEAPDQAERATGEQAVFGGGFEVSPSSAED